jgi:hypothetical protein
MLRFGQASPVRVCVSSSGSCDGDTGYGLAVPPALNDSQAITGASPAPCRRPVVAALTRAWQAGMRYDRKGDDSETPLSVSNQESR